MTKRSASVSESIIYYLRSTNSHFDPQSSFQKIIDYLLTFVGDIEVQIETKENKKASESIATVYILGTPHSSSLKLEKTGQITVILNPNDSITISLIANIAKGISLRIYNPQTNSYLLNDPNIFDLTSFKINPKIESIISKYNLTPLYQYRDSLVFFAKAADGSVHLINRHLLEYLLENNIEKLPKDEFNIKVSDSIDEFVALFDRGLIPLSFHKYLSEDSKIVNLSGLDIKSVYTDLSVFPVYFSFDKENQSYIQNENLSYPNRIDIKKHGSIIKSMSDIPYRALKIAGDISYEMVSKKLKPKISISVFI